MLGESYFKFYNTISAAHTTTNTILSDYLDYICTHYESICCGFCAVIENGHYRVIHEQGSAFHLDTPLTLMTSDVHKKTYDLENYYITNTIEVEGLTFISPSKTARLFENIYNSSKIGTNVLNLLFYHNDYLVANIILFCQIGISLSNEEITELLFLRNNISSLIYPIFVTNKEASTQHLLDVGESILNSSHYQTGDVSTFLSRLLDLTLELCDEADYGSCLLLENGLWTYVNAVGHDAERLKTVKLPTNIFNHQIVDSKISKEVAPHIYIIRNILQQISSPIQILSESMLKKVDEASLPIKETIQLHMYFDGVLKGVISIDIKKDSTMSFTYETICLLKKINFLSQILLTYSTMISKTQSFERLTDLISKLIVSHHKGQSSFLNDFLKLLVDSIYEADYACAYIRDKDNINFLATIGHSLEGLQSLNLKPEHFVSTETIDQNQIHFNGRYSSKSPVSTTLFSDIQHFAKGSMPKELYNKYMTASLPIKNSIISQAKLDEDVYMYISCDIKKRSVFSFTRSSMHLFSVLNNLGFSFISNSYFIDQYKTLNEELEDAIALRTKELKDSNKKLKDIAKRDSLTGLLNHKTIIKRLTDKVEKSSPLSILLCDIDYFKKVNDIYGHQTGDRVLLEISNIFKSELSDNAGRYGGEEFLLILPNLDATQATAYCEKLLDRIRNTEFIKNYQITISGGVVTYKEGSATSIISTADSLLYEAKEDGRDRLKFDYC